MHWKYWKKGGGIINNITLETKPLISIKEASELYGIGQHRLRDIMRDDFECRYHLKIGRTIKIKRQLFEEFLNKSVQI